jgi:hypothetical protein
MFKKNIIDEQYPSAYSKELKKITANIIATVNSPTELQKVFH